MVREVDCEEIRELLDGYALGAADSHESRLIEVHVADCVRCWEELSVSNRTAALLALSVRIEHPRSALEAAIMRQAERDLAKGPERAPLWKRFALSPWPATAGAFGAISIVALVVSGMLLFEVEEVRDKNSALEMQIQAAALSFEQTTALTKSQFEEQGAIVAILAGADHEEIEMKPRGNTASEAFYTWSAEKGMGAVLCQGLPQLEPGKVYMLWLKTEQAEHPLIPFISSDGKCQVTMDLSWLHEKPKGIGMTIEDAPGTASEPNKPWFMYASFPES
jgi:hypothetical protein